MLKICDDEIVRLHNDGLLNREIAAIAGCATCTITSKLNKLGIRTYRFDKTIAIDMHNDGLSDAEIAMALGCTRSNITAYLNKHGITGRKSKIENIALRNQISKSLSGRFVGPNNPNYKGYKDVKSVARGIFKTISKELIRNSGYRCAICGRHGGNMETHHIKPFGLIMDEFIKHAYDGNINTVYEQLMSYDDFTDRNNLVVMCKKCHHNVHYTDNPELSPYRWESATTIKRTPRWRNQVEYTQAGGSAGALTESVI